MVDIYLALATAAITVLLCTADITEGFRQSVRILKVFDCPFCTSWWVAFALMCRDLPLQDWWIRLPAIVCVANIAILLIHLSLTTVIDEN